MSDVRSSPRLSQQRRQHQVCAARGPHRQKRTQRWFVVKTSVVTVQRVTACNGPSAVQHVTAHPRCGVHKMTRLSRVPQDRAMKTNASTHLPFHRKKKKKKKKKKQHQRREIRIEGRIVFILFLGTHKSYALGFQRHRKWREAMKMAASSGRRAS